MPTWHGMSSQEGFGQDRVPAGTIEPTWPSRAQERWRPDTVWGDAAMLKRLGLLLSLMLAGLPQGALAQDFPT
ncbi:hypothetical protein ABTA52_19965, partial [Acinetobacter baumannii]